MSRQILFRAKRRNWRELPKEEWWVEGDLSYIVHGKKKMYIFPAEGYDSADRYEVDPETLCQYTGLTDKNGKPIWENDIVSNTWYFARSNSIVRYGEYKDWYMTEKFKCGNLGFFLEHTDVRESMYIRKDIIYFADHCEVIGNIFDNPELLERGDGTE